MRAPTSDKKELLKRAKEYRALAQGYRQTALAMSFEPDRATMLQYAAAAERAAEELEKQASSGS